MLFRLKPGSFEVTLFYIICLYKYGCTLFGHDVYCLTPNSLLGCPTWCKHRNTRSIMEDEVFSRGNSPKQTLSQVSELLQVT